MVFKKQTQNNLGSIRKHLALMCITFMSTAILCDGRYLPESGRRRARSVGSSAEHTDDMTAQPSALLQYKPKFLRKTRLTCACFLGFPPVQKRNQTIKMLHQLNSISDKPIKTLLNQNIPLPFFIMVNKFSYLRALKFYYFAKAKIQFNNLA